LLVAGAAKWDRPAAVWCAEWKHIQPWVVDVAAPKAARKTVLARGVVVVVARGVAGE